MVLIKTFNQNLKVLRIGQKSLNTLNIYNIHNKMGKTLIQISDELWSKLNSMKTPDDKTFEEVIWRIIKNEKRI